jgi:hypothetical protein
MGNDQGRTHRAMQVHKTTFILMLLASLTTACTTDFTTSDTGQDTSVDTTDDTTADGTPDVDPDGPDVVPDLTDVPMDTGTDVPPPDPITCHAEEGFWYEVPEGELLTWGCDDLGDCSHVNLWLTFANQTLVAMIGADRVEGVEKPGFFATLIDPESMAVVANGQVTMPFEAENTWYSLSGGSVVQGQTDEASVIFTSRTSTGGTTPETQNLRVVTIFDDLDVLSYQVHVLLNGMMPSGENGQLSQPRVIRSSWGEYYVFVMIEEESPLFMNNQLYGATFSTADFTDVGSSFQFGVRFQELQPVRNQSFFPGLPDEMDGNIVMPYMHLDMNEDIGSYHAGLWIQDDPITPGSPPGPIERPAW